MKYSDKKSLLKRIRIGIRLNTPPPKVILTKKDYRRKPKHRKDYSNEEE